MLKANRRSTAEGRRGLCYITAHTVAQRTADIWRGFSKKSANFIFGSVTQQHTPNLIEPAVQFKGTL